MINLLMKFQNCYLFFVMVAQTDRRTGGQAESNMPFFSFFKVWGIKCVFKSKYLSSTPKNFLDISDYPEILTVKRTMSNMYYTILFLCQHANFENI